MANKPNTTIETAIAEVGPSEITPLISHGTPIDTHKNATSKKAQSPVYICLMVVAVITLLQGGDQLMDSPQTRLIESVSCYRYYQQHDPSMLLTTPDQAGPGAIYGTHEMWCKKSAVQAEVIDIRLYQNFYDGIPALLLAVPLGWLQDRYGRRPFLILGMFSFIFKSLWTGSVLWFWQSFPDLRWIWLSSLHALVMGGSPVVSALIFTMIADITTPAQRAIYLSKVGAGALLTTVIVPPISAWLMQFNPWIPAGLGLLLTIIGTVLTFIVPETLGYHAEDNDRPRNDIDEATVSVAVETKWYRKVLVALRNETACLWEDKRVPVAIAPFLIHILTLQATQLLVQYASKRFEFSLAKATVLVTVRAGMLVTVLWTIVPELSRFLVDRYGLSIKYKDLLITKVSFLVMSAGWVVVGIAPAAWLFIIGLIVTALGTGAIVTLRSFLTTLVHRDQVARVFSIVCVVDTFGLMFGSVILAKSYDLGMEIGGTGLGLPFFVLGSICAFFFLLLSIFVRLRKDERGVPEIIVAEDDL